MRELRELHSPYPGLRPFGSDELSIFFGREAHTSRLIEILHRERFLAVVGPSGAGKSSLVRAGLLPALALGWPGEVSDWRVAELRPGERPMRRLAEALLQPDVLGRELGALDADTGDAAGAADDGTISRAHQAALVEAELRSGPDALAGLVADAQRQRPGQPPFNLLVLVDQFEELFRYADLGERQGQEADGFIEQLLASARATQGDARRIHVVLTMRTDALHDCARFLDLPEAINRGQYLVPRLKTDELRRAISEPARVFDGTVAPEVVDALLGHLRTAPDQLPLLQHALAQMWRTASARNARQPTITAADAQAAGGLEQALSKHAEALYAGLPTDDDRALADLLLRAITGPGDGGRLDSRRPQRLDQITRFAGLPPEEWPRFSPVLRAFAAEGANFLHFAEPLAADTVVDISHEALIRGWDRLRALVEWEAALAAQYRRWRDRSEHHWRTGGERLSGADLQAALRWRSGHADLEPGVGRMAEGTSVLRPFPPHAAWTERYALTPSPDAAAREFGALLDFIDASEREASGRAAEEARKEAERETARQREAEARLEAERERAERERLKAAAEAERAEAAERERALAKQGERRTRRWLVIALVVALAALAMAGLAWNYWQLSERTADKEREALIEATALRLAAEGQAIVAGARSGDTEQGLLRVLAAHRIRPGTEPNYALQSVALLTERLTRVVHTTSPYSVAFSPDGTRIVSGSWDNELQLWDARTGAALGEPLSGHSSSVNSVAFSPDGTRIVSGSGEENEPRWDASGSDNTLRLWDARTGAALVEPLYGHSKPVNSVAFSPDGTRIVSGSDDDTLRLWDARTGAALGEPLHGHSRSVNSVAFSPDGTRIVSGSADNTLRLWDAKTGAALGKPLRGHSSSVNSVAFSPDGTRIVSGSSDDTLRLWDAKTGAALGKPLHGHSKPVKSVAFSPNGTLIVSGSGDHTLRLWDARTGAELGEPLRGHSNSVTSVAFSHDGTRIASGSYDDTLRLWDAQTGVAPGELLHGHYVRVYSVAFSPDGTRIVSGGGDCMLRLWDARTGAALGKPLRVHKHSGDVYSVAFSPDGTRIVSGSSDETFYPGIHIGGTPHETLRLWDARTGEALGEPLRGHSFAVNSVAFSPDGTRIVSGSYDNTLRLWDARTGAALGTLVPGHSNSVTSVAFSPDGTRIVSGSADNTLRLWDAKTGAALGEPLSGHSSSVNSVAFSPDGTRIVSGSSDDTLRLWDAKTGAALGEPLSGHSSSVNSVAFSPDGTRIVSGSYDNTLRLWDARTGAALGTLVPGHSNSVTSVAFSPDGTRIVSGSWDNTLRLWRVPDAWANILCAKLTRNMSHAEWRRWVGDLPYQKQCPSLPDPADAPTHADKASAKR